MDTPLPLVTKPTISSPGTGLQHFEKRTATSWIPSTTNPLLDFFLGVLSLISAMVSRTLSSVISYLFFILYSSSSLLTIWPSYRPPCPTAASTESQSRKPYLRITTPVNSGFIKSLSTIAFALQ